jgi:hypothetical protein
MKMAYKDVINNEKPKSPLGDLGVDLPAELKIWFTYLGEVLCGTNEIGSLFSGMMFL